MALIDWVYALLYWLGIWRKSATVVFLGLDNAGKTTLLYKLKDGMLAAFVPTQRAQVQQLAVGNLTIQAWDLGGHMAVRQLWRDYYLKADAILFMVDAADPARFGEAREELHFLMDDVDLQAVPVAVLANKKDLPVFDFGKSQYSVAMEAIVPALGLESYLSSNAKRPFALFQTSVVDGAGYPEAFQWLSSFV